MKIQPFRLALFLLLPFGLPKGVQAFLNLIHHSDFSFRIASSVTDSEIAFDLLENKNVLVVGGSGRVGGSVVTQLLKHGAYVTVGGTRVESYEQAKQRWIDLFPQLDVAKIRFEKVNREVAASVLSVLQSNEYDMVVHTAGPFQGKVGIPNGVIEAAVKSRVPYVDVCDDYCTARAAKTKYATLAEDLKVPCILSTGCWVSVLVDSRLESFGT